MLKVGIIGAGRIGKVHAQSICNFVPNAQVKAIADPFMNADTQAWAKSLGIPVVTKDYQEILKDDLLRYRARYREKHLNEEGILTADEYIRRVSHNYLLDRISANSNQIGFINEFIFGILVGDAVRDGFLKVEEMSERFIDMSATAFAVREEGIRKEYYGKISGYLKQASNICRLNAEMCLLHQIDSDYESGYFRSILFLKA